MRALDIREKHNKDIIQTGGPRFIKRKSYTQRGRNNKKRMREKREGDRYQGIEALGQGGHLLLKKRTRSMRLAIARGEKETLHGSKKLRNRTHYGERGGAFQ